MKLVTFHSPGRETRIGALAADSQIVDLNAAYATYLRNERNEGAFYALADARVPAEMRRLFENGDRGLNAARAALDYALKLGPEAAGPSGEPPIFPRKPGEVQAPLQPKKLFHPAG